MLRPESTNSATVQAEHSHNRKLAKSNYDTKACAGLPSLQVGDAVYVKPPPTKRGQPWKFGHVTDLSGPRSYTVKGDSVVRRNRVQLRLLRLAQPHENFLSDDETANRPATPPLTPERHGPRDDTGNESEILTRSDTPSHNDQETNDETDDETDCAPNAYRTRSGRLSTRPQKYQ